MPARPGSAQRSLVYSEDDDTGWIQSGGGGAARRRGRPRRSDGDWAGVDYGTGAVQQQAGGIDRSPECLENRSNRIKRTRADYAFELVQRRIQLVVAAGARER